MANFAAYPMFQNSYYPVLPQQQAGLFLAHNQAAMLAPYPPNHPMMHMGNANNAVRQMMQSSVANNNATQPAYIFVAQAPSPFLMQSGDQMARNINNSSNKDENQVLGSMQFDTNDYSIIDQDGLMNATAFQFMPDFQSLGQIFCANGNPLPMMALSNDPPQNMFMIGTAASAQQTETIQSTEGAVFVLASKVEAYLLEHCHEGSMRSLTVSLAMKQLYPKLTESVLAAFDLSWHRFVLHSPNICVFHYRQQDIDRLGLYGYAEEHEARLRLVQYSKQECEHRDVSYVQNIQLNAHAATTFALQFIKESPSGVIELGQLRTFLAQRFPAFFQDMTRSAFKRLLTRVPKTPIWISGNYIKLRRNFTMNIVDSNSISSVPSVEGATSEDSSINSCLDAAFADAEKEV